MEHIDLTLEKNKSFVSTNQTKNLHVDLEREEKLLPVSSLQGNIDAYEQYLKEKDACNKYRFVFTIHPYCTNVLFNHITEAVYMEGSNTAALVNDEYEASQNTQLGYRGYKVKDGGAVIEQTSGANIGSPITRDTGYSCDTYGVNGIDKDKTFLNYNCGLDIFNNHLLRRKEFVCVNKWKTPKPENSIFNTVFDEVRDPWGSTIEGFTWLNPGTPSASTKLHVYNTDNIYNFRDSISHNLREQNGWLGFYNTSILNTVNETVGTKTGGSINKVLNNVEACAFVDMYPTRQHYSFVPHFNNYRKRVENNWEYILTYPYKNVYDTPLTFDSGRNIYGILSELVLDGYTLEQILGLDDVNPIDPPLTVLFKTHMQHTLLPGDRLVLHIYNKNDGSSSEEEAKVFTLDNIIVQSIGNNGYDGQHYFSLRLNDISTDLELAHLLNTNGTLGFRFEKTSVASQCRYYVRKFKKIPNFKNTNINIADGITDDEINEALKSYDFSSCLNKLGFSKTAYGDDVAQIVYDDDINVTGLRDNLGRQLSVLYLTLVKTNNGHREWYNQKNYTASTVEYSHCFGEVTSGFDLPVDVTDPQECNVRRQHNVTGNAKSCNDVPNTSGFIETDLTKNGSYDSSIGDFNYEFYGDVVEFDVATLEEHVIERIYHRFNTAQREFSDGYKYVSNKKNSNPFSFLVIDELTGDDYTPGGFTVETRDAVSKAGKCNYWANIAPEGYYYRPHYPIVIKEFDTVVNTGYHTQINFTYDESSANTIVTDTNYYLETNKELFMFHKDAKNKHKYIVRIGEVSGDNFTTVELILPNLEDTDLNNYILFKPNILKPEGAYDFSELAPEFIEKSGKYLWRDVLPSSKIQRDSEIYDAIFTNGAIYIHKNINFYLKRQDPYGEYGLHPTYVKNLTDCMMPWELEFDGNDKDISDGDYFEPGENNVC